MPFSNNKTLFSKRVYQVFLNTVSIYSLFNSPNICECVRLICFWMKNMFGFFCPCLKSLALNCGYKCNRHREVRLLDQGFLITIVGPPPGGGKKEQQRHPLTQPTYFPFILIVINTDRHFIIIVLLFQF